MISVWVVDTFNELYGKSSEKHNNIAIKILILWTFRTSSS